MNQYVIEPAQKIPVAGKYDVVVCGGGPSGVMAALAARRNGSSTLLIEQYGFLGGMATTALVGPISKFNLNGERIVSGIPEEFIDNMESMAGAITDLPSGNIPYDPEVYKYVAQRMVLDAGVDILYHSKITNVICDAPDTVDVQYVVIDNKSGRQAIHAEYFIDCTGTGELLKWSNLPWKMRKNSAGELQPVSLYFRIGGVNTSGMKLLMAEDGQKYANADLASILNEEVEKGQLQNFGGPWVVHGSTLRPGEVSVNATRIKCDATNGRDFSNAEIKLREDVFTIFNIFKQRYPAFKKAYLMDTAAQVGIRETRSIVGEYTMEVDDVLNPRGFKDTIAKGGHPVDIHHTGGAKQSVNFIRKAYDIPYRALVPQNAVNLVVGGGTISASREAFASIRVQAQCMALGQAAGTAVSICKSENLAVSKLEGSYLREQLKLRGAIV